MPKNPVGELVKQLGGTVRTAAAAGTAVNTVTRAMAAGRFVSAVACVRLARHVHPDDETAQMRLVARLAGLPET
jgi:hypothetical protein